MKLQFGLHLLNTDAKIGREFEFSRRIINKYKGLSSLAGKVVKIIGEDNRHHLFHLNRGNVWISKWIFDDRLVKPLEIYKSI